LALACILSPLYAQELFAAGYRTLSARVEVQQQAAATDRDDTSDLTRSTTLLTIADSIDALSSRVYRVPLSATGVPLSEAEAEVVPVVTTNPNATNLLFNSGFEFCTSVGSADGFWAAWGGKRRNRLLCANLILGLKMINSPTQARDKHRKNSTQEWRILTGDGAATNLVVTNVVHSGAHSMQLRAPVKTATFVPFLCKKCIKR
jgi:hypothetical protein